MSTHILHSTLNQLCMAPQTCHVESFFLCILLGMSDRQHFRTVPNFLQCTVRYRLKMETLQKLYEGRFSPFHPVMCSLRQIPKVSKNGRRLLLYLLLVPRLSFLFGAFQNKNSRMLPAPHSESTGSVYTHTSVNTTVQQHRLPCN